MRGSINSARCLMLFGVALMYFLYGRAAFAQSAGFVFDVDRQAALRSLGKIFLGDLAVGEAGAVSIWNARHICLSGDRSIAINSNIEIMSPGLASDWVPVNQWRVQRLAQNSVSLSTVILTERQQTAAQRNDSVRLAIAELLRVLQPCDVVPGGAIAASQWLRVQSINGTRQASQLLMQVR